jgi:predicted CopG family antitoxin
MFMATKTLTITEDAYNLLANNKLENESFSKEITRLFSEKKKRPLSDFFGILSDIDGESMKRDLEKYRALDIKLEKTRRVF